MRRTTILLILAVGMYLVCIGSNACSQGLFSYKGHSGLYFGGGYATCDNISGYGFDIGETLDGILDIGVRSTKLKHKSFNYYYYYVGHKREQWSTGYYLREYTSRAKATRRGNLVVFFTQGVTWISEEAASFGSGTRAFLLGGGISFDMRVDKNLVFYVVGEYDRALYSENRKGENIFEFDIYFSSPLTIGRLVLGPSVSYGEQYTTFGVQAAINAYFH